MKRKYAALVLGLTMSLTAMNVAYATETESLDTANEEVMEEEITVEEVCGQVKEVGENSITIVVGDLIYEIDTDEVFGDEEISEEEALDEESAEEMIEEDVEENEDLNSDDMIEEEILEGEIEEILSDEDLTEILELSEEERTIAITLNTIIERELDDTAEAEDEDAQIDDSEEENSEEEMQEEFVEVLLEKISLEEIQPGDVVQIILDEEGNADYITVLLLEEENILEASEVEEEFALEEDEEA